MLTEIIHSPLSEQVIIIIIAALPVVELRGSLPVALDIFHMSWYQSMALSIVGNLLPIPFLLLFYDWLARIASRKNTGKRFMEWLYRRTRRQTGLIAKYRHVGMVILVAIPFPGTGAWTASIAAHILGIRFWIALLDIAIGVIGAGFVVTVLVSLGWIGASIAFLGIILFAAISLRRGENPET
jgi:uncharacterized membrane protein